MKYIKKFYQEFDFIFLIFILWRVILFAAGLVGFGRIRFLASFPYIDQLLISTHLPQSIWQWANFDGVHYLYLAARGYAADGLHVFFPLFPIFIKIFSFLTWGNYLLAGLLVSNLAIILAAIVFYKLISKKFSKEVATWAVLFLFCFPTSFYFGSVYTESLFLLFILCFFYFSGVKGQLFGFLGGLTRLVGVALGPMAWLGLGAYILFLDLVYHRPLAFIESQAAFHNARASSLSTLITPPQVVWRYLKIFTTASPANFNYWLAVLEFSAFFFGVAILLWLTLKRKVPISWLIFSWLALLMPTFSGTFSSMPRYLLVIFPIFVGLAMIKNKKIKLVILVFFGILQLVLTVLFTRGYFIS